MLRAREIIKRDLPECRLRFVGINSLTYGAIGTADRKLSQATFSDYFTDSLPVLASFHGYPETLKTILGNYADRNRLEVRGFLEEGTTTTPLEMLALNHNSRFDLAATIARKLNRPDLAEKYLKVLDDNRTHAHSFGVDKIELN